MIGQGSAGIGDDRQERQDGADRHQLGHCAEQHRSIRARTGNNCLRRADGKCRYSLQLAVTSLPPRASAIAVNSFALGTVGSNA